MPEHSVHKNTRSDNHVTSFASNECSGLVDLDEEELEELDKQNGGGGFKAVMAATHGASFLPCFQHHATIVPSVENIQLATGSYNSREMHASLHCPACSL
jgi:hypothetical protein